ncbi:putative L-tryptophan--pyruvate aminotransferase 1 [Cocos nucifera]|nr:putative L-tryptophan--pyruvate aminotransferase 1 [Cocos nucifera]
MIFTVSKSIGHAGSRIGWALVKDTAVALKMVKFLEISTIGVSKVSQIRAAKILKAVSDSYENPIPGNQDKVFDFGRHLLANRWKKLRELVKASGIFSLPEFPSETCKFTGEKAETLPGM